MARFDTKDLGSSDEDVSRLAGSFVHEVRNPLSTLNINAQLVLEDWPQPETPREERLTRRLNVMKEEINRIQQTIDAFLRLVRHERMESKLVDVDAILSELTSHHRELLDRSGIRILTQIEPNLAPVRGDAALLRQVFLNLLRNAESAMPDGGDLFLRARNVESMVEVEVVDTGTGIAPDQLPAIFSPYVSASAGGTGLGLPITLKIVRQHGGEITVESELGTGSSFMVRLPAGASTTSDGGRARVGTS